MNNLISRSASSASELLNIAATGLEPLGGIIASRANAADTSDFSMSVVSSGIGGTSFIDSSGKTAFTKQSFSDLPNSAVNAGLDIKAYKSLSRGLAADSIGSSGSSGSITSSGSTGASSGGGSAQLQPTLQSNKAAARLPAPSQITSREEALSWLQKVSDPQDLLTQSWFNSKLIQYKTHVVYKQTPYGDLSAQARYVCRASPRTERVSMRRSSVIIRIAIGFLLVYASYSLIVTTVLMCQGYDESEKRQSQEESFYLKMGRLLLKDESVLDLDARLGDAIEAHQIGFYSIRKDDKDVSFGSDAGDE